MNYLNICDMLQFFLKLLSVFYLGNGFQVVAVNPLSANPTKRSNTFKQFAGNLPTNCLSVFDHFVGFRLKD